MTERLKNIFQLTDNGARGLVRASISSFFSYFGFLIPMMMVLFFVQSIMEGREKGIGTYFMILVPAFLGIYVLSYINYNTLYKETYAESKLLRIEIANILKGLPLSYFSKHDVSDLSQTVMKDVADIEHAMSHAIPRVIGFAFYFVIIVIMMLFANAKLALAILIPIVLAIMAILVSKQAQKRSTKIHYDVLRENSESFQEAIELQQEIKSYGRIKRTKDALYKSVDNAEKIHIKSEFAQALPVNLSLFLNKFSLGLTIIVGIIMYQNNEVSLLYLIGFLICGAKISDGISDLTMNVAEVLYIDARIKRIKEIREAPIQEGEEVEIKSYDIEFKNVEFSYNKDRKVIDDVSFVAKQGEVTALVGPSGCGKTSILRLMSRLYDYDKGQILIDNKDISKIDTDCLFKHISIVFQEVILFNTTIMENIRIGNKNATNEEVMKAARLANCEEFILKLENGYDTLIGENGSKLSGGERQRLSIARAILKNAPIIILDEISASLDLENEMKIQEGLNLLIKDKTVVIISHRLKSIENVDKIIVLNNGKVEGIGKHDELMESCGLYRGMIEKSHLTEKYMY